MTQKTLEELLMNTVATSGGCMEWKSVAGTRKYAKVRIGGKKFTASRVIMELVTGKKIPDGFQVCHSCDNPPCLNPDHLFLGTGQDNIQDSIKKGRFKFSQGQTKKHKDDPNIIIELAKKIIAKSPDVIIGPRCDVTKRDYTSHA